MVDADLKIIKQNLSSDARRQEWMASESYFAHSWTHIFYCWKCRRLMIGRTIRDILSRTTPTARRVIDLGCGSGGSIFEVFDFCADLKGVHWFGLDVDIGAVSSGSDRSRFRQRARKTQPVEFSAGDISALPIADESIDLVVCSEVLEHIAHPPTAIEEMARILKPDGYALITTPNPNNLVERIGYALDRVSFGGLKKIFWAGCDEISAPSLKADVGLGHVSVYPYKTWLRWLKAAGISVIRKVRGPMIFGGPFFDRHPFFSGCMIAVDPLLDRMPFRFLLSNNLGLFCRKQSEPAGRNLG